MRADPLNHGLPPHAGQERVYISPAKLRINIAANRTGKTFGAMREGLWRATGTHPYRKLPPQRMLWFGYPDHKFFQRATKPVFDQLCPKDRLLQFHESEKWAKIRNDDGGISTIHFMSYEAGRETWQGAAVDFVWLDEECPEDIYREALARLIDRRGDMLITQTPVSGLGWLYDRLYLPGLAEQSKPIEKRKIDIIRMPLALYDENAPYGVGEPAVPHMSRDQIMRFAEGIVDPDERAIRVFGEFRSRSGVVYKEFDPNIHVVPRFEVPSHYEFWAGVDPGTHGFAVIFLAMSETGRIYVVDEYFDQGSPFRVRALEIHKRAKKFLPEGETLTLFVDTADPQSVVELNLWASGDMNGIELPLSFASLDQGAKARIAGITRVQELLSPNPTRSTPREVTRPRSARGEPLLYIMDDIHSKWTDGEEGVEACRLAWELARYLWKTKKDAPHPTDADEFTAGGAHALAALRYGVMARLSSPTPPKPDQLAGLSHRDRLVWESIQEPDLASDDDSRWVIE